MIGKMSLLLKVRLKKLSEADLMLLRCMRNQHVSVDILQKKKKPKKHFVREVLSFS